MIYLSVWESSHPLLYSPNACQQQNWAKSKPGAGKLARLPMHAPSLLPPSVCLNRKLEWCAEQGLESRRSAVGWGMGAKQGLHCYAECLPWISLSKATLWEKLLGLTTLLPGCWKGCIGATILSWGLLLFPLESCIWFQCAAGGSVLLSLLPHLPLYFIPWLLYETASGMRSELMRGRSGPWTQQ